MRPWAVIVSKDVTMNSYEHDTLHEHECERGDRAERSRRAFFNRIRVDNIT
jgi:hypothetical protein